MNGGKLFMNSSNQEVKVQRFNPKLTNTPATKPTAMGTNIS